MTVDLGAARLRLVAFLHAYCTDKASNSASFAPLRSTKSKLRRWPEAPTVHSSECVAT